MGQLGHAGDGAPGSANAHRRAKSARRKSQRFGAFVPIWALERRQCPNGSIRCGMVRCMQVDAHAFWLRAPGSGEIRPVTLPEPGPNDVMVRTLRSGISRGTETLVF